MMNMKLLEAVALPYIHHGCSTWKTFWEGKFTGEKKFTLGELSAAKVKNGGRLSVTKQREIKGSYKYVALEISLKFDSMDKTRITSSESKVKLGISGKGLITSTSLRDKTRQKIYKKTRHAIRNVSKKDLSKIIRDFEKLPCESYEKKRPKHEPTSPHRRGDRP